MWLTYALLFLVTVLAGIAPLFISRIESRYFHLALVFSGSYLFGIALIHLMPEIFSGPVKPRIVALWIAIGFFMQVLMDYVTSGVEHGHLHKQNHSHHHGGFTMFTLLLAMGIHAVLEGVLLLQPASGFTHQHHQGLLLGVILHKIPAAFALMSIIQCHYRSRAWPVLIMILFASATPLGMMGAGYLINLHLLHQEMLTIIFALVTGNFLHISTTIFFESSPGHQFHGWKLLVILAGAGIAIGIEFMA